MSQEHQLKIEAGNKKGKKGKKRSSAEGEEQFYGVTLFYRNKQMYQDEWSNPDFHEDGFDIKLPEYVHACELMILICFQCLLT